MSETKARSLAKATSYRLLGTALTIAIAWWMTGEASIAAQIGGLDVIVKMIAYYLHERVWAWIPQKDKISSTKDLHAESNNH